MNSVTLASQRFENPITKRYYRILVSQDLLGDWVITKIWGGINYATGRIVHVPCETKEQALKILNELSKKRLKRGYLLIKGIG